MTVSEVVVATNPGGTFSESGIARDRPRWGELRRPQPGGQRRAHPRGHAGPPMGLKRLVNTTVRLGGRVGGALPGRKVLTLVHAIVAGGSHIDHAEMLRSGASEAVLPQRAMAPSTLARSFRPSPSGMSPARGGGGARHCAGRGPWGWGPERAAWSSTSTQPSDVEP